MSVERRRRRTVATRIVFSFVVLLLLFAAASTWSVVAFRQAVAEAALLRQGYLPLALSLRDTVSQQDSWNSQLNHVTTAKNPADARVWFETALSVGRPRKLSEVRRALDSALPSAEASIARQELEAELSKTEGFMEQDKKLVKSLFSALAQNDVRRAEGV